MTASTAPYADPMWHLDHINAWFRGFQADCSRQAKIAALTDRASFAIDDAHAAGEQALREAVAVHDGFSREWADEQVARALEDVMSEHFTRGLHAAIQEQIRFGWPGETAYNLAVADVYRRYDSNAMAERASLRCVGGQDGAA